MKMTMVPLLYPSVKKFKDGANQNKCACIVSTSSVLLTIVDKNGRPQRHFNLKINKQTTSVVWRRIMSKTLKLFLPFHSHGKVSSVTFASLYFKIFLSKFLNMSDFVFLFNFSFNFQSFFFLMHFYRLDIFTTIFKGFGAVIFFRDVCFSSCVCKRVNIKIRKLSIQGCLK